MKLITNNASQSETLGSNLFKMSPPELRTIRFLVNCVDGYKFIACMETETTWEGERLLSSWTLFGSLKPIDRIMNGSSKGFMETIRPRLPVVSGSFEQCRAFRPGASLHARCKSSDTHHSASQAIDDFAYDYFEAKRKRGYVFPMSSGQSFRTTATIQALDWLSNLSDLGGNDWMNCGAWATPPAPLPQHTDAMSLLGAPRRRILSLQPPQQ